MEIISRTFRYTRNKRKGRSRTSFIVYFLLFVSKNFAFDQVDKQKPSFREWFQIGYVVVLQQNDQGAGDDQVVTQKGKQRKLKII